MQKSLDPAASSQASFERWRHALQEDCERQGKLMAFEAMGEIALRSFWERGTEPSVDGILHDGDADPSRA